MLCLTIKQGHTLTIGSATVLIREIKGDKVFVGVEAPREVPIQRDDCVKAPDSVKTIYDKEPLPVGQ